MPSRRALVAPALVGLTSPARAQPTPQWETVKARFLP